MTIGWTMMRCVVLAVAVAISGASGFDFPLAWPHKAELLKKSSKVEEIKEFLSHPSEWFGGSAEHTAAHKDGDVVKKKNLPPASKQASKQTSDNQEKKKISPPPLTIAEQGNKPVSDDGHEKGWLDWLNKWTRDHTANHEDAAEPKPVKPDTKDAKPPSRFSWWPWFSHENGAPQIPPVSDKETPVAPVQPALPPPALIQSPKVAEQPIAQPVPQQIKTPVESVGTGLDKQDVAEPPVVSNPMGADQTWELERCIDSCEKKLAYGVVSTMDGRTAQRKQNADAFVTCADACVVQYQKKPILLPADSGHWSPLGWREFLEHTGGTFWIVFAGMVAVLSAVVVAVRTGTAQKLANWVGENLPDSARSFGDSLMAEGSFCRTIADGCVFAVHTCRDGMRSVAAGVTGGMGGETNSEREGLVAEEDRATVGAQRGWLREAKELAGRGMYGAGQVAVYLLSVSYLPDDIAIYVPWSDAAVRMGYEGAADGELEMGLEGDIAGGGNRGGVLSTASTARGSVEMGALLGDKGNSRNASGANSRRHHTADPTFEKTRSQNFQRSGTGSRRGSQSFEGGGSSDDNPMS